MVNDNAELAGKVPSTRCTGPQRDTVIDALARAVAAAPDRTFLDFEGEKHTFAQFDAMARRLAAAFRSHGIGTQAEDAVSAMIGNNADSLHVWLAANMAGALWAPVNTALRRDFLASQLADTGSRLIVVEEELFERIAEVAADLPRLEVVLVRGRAPVAALGKVKVESLDACRSIAPLQETAQPLPADIACILYTSGTTGPSKGCMISHNYILHQAKQVIQTTPVYDGDVAWTPMPLFHIGALTGAVLPALLLQEGAAIAPRFSVSGFWDEIERSGARVAYVLASMIPLIANAPECEAEKRCFGQIHSVWGLPFSPELKRKWQDRFGVKWINCYGFGQTEGGKICTAIPGEPLPPETSNGRVADEFDCIIADDEDNEVPRGTIGEVLYRPKKPDIMFSGYWKKPEATAEAWRNLWMHSGDFGKMDEEGWFTFVGRKKDSIRRRGENISTFECEMVLSKHPDLKEAVVHAVPSPLGEDDVKVTAILQDGTSLTERQLCDWCIEHFPYFAVPRYYEFRTDLPRTTTGKPLKYVLRDEGCTPATWDMETAGVKVPRR
jgi:crotonobetaine/carnitine-CoA ligase